MKLAARNPKLLRRDVISGIHAAIAVGILIGAVSVAYFVLGFPAIVSIAGGGFVGYIIARVILRYLVPQVPSVNDAERLQMRLGRRWLIWTVAMTLFFHFATPLSWAVSFGVATGTGFLGWLMDHRKRVQAQANLLNDKDGPCGAGRGQS